MSQVVKNHFNRLVDSAIVVIGTRDIVPAMVFSKIGRYSAYIEHYYIYAYTSLCMFEFVFWEYTVETY